MMSFSRDAHAADLEMRAVLFILVAFAHIDGSFDGAERGFIRDVVDELSERRADELFGRGAPERADVLPRWKAHFYHVIAGMEHEVRSHLTESVAEGESSSQFVLAKLKLRCFELLGHLAPQNRAPLLQSGKLQPQEQAFILMSMVPNRKGQPLLVEWQVAHRRVSGDRAGAFVLEPFDSFAKRAGLQAGKLPNRGQGACAVSTEDNGRTCGRGRDEFARRRSAGTVHPSISKHRIRYGTACGA